MAFLIEISFDKSFRLRRNTYYFKYKGIRFKLIQDKSGKKADHLLTIIPQYKSLEIERAYSTAAEFLSALSWESEYAVAVWDGGGRGWPDRMPLRRALPCTLTYPRIPFRGPFLIQNLTQIPYIATKEQRIALALFREARAANNDYLSFLFYWQILEVKGGKADDVANELYGKHRKDLVGIPSNVDQLPLAGRTIGKYLKDDCRHAIAHIKRTPGRRQLDLDKFDDQMFLGISNRLVCSLAKYYIANTLKLSERSYLVRPCAGGFPRFTVKDSSLHYSFNLAYP